MVFNSRPLYSFKKTEAVSIYMCIPWHSDLQYAFKLMRGRSFQIYQTVIRVIKTAEILTNHKIMDT